MKNKIFWQLIITNITIPLFTVFLCFTIMLNGLLFTSPKRNCYIVSTNIDTETHLFSNDLVWKYKVINGVLYKRLYDRTNGKWIGNWIRV